MPGDSGGRSTEPIGANLLLLACCRFVVSHLHRRNAKHGAATVRHTAAATVGGAFVVGRVFVDFEGVVDGELLADSDVAHDVDEDTAIDFDRFAVRHARVIQPTGTVSSTRTINDAAV